MSGDDPVEIDRYAEVAPYIQLADALRQRIASGDLPAGRAIPSFPKLMEMSGLARNTVQKAVDLLSEEGLLRTAPGRGMFVIRPDEADQT